MSRFVVGVDEAGRGPLAGPLSVAAVLMPAGRHPGSGCRICREIADSKQLTAERREAIYACLTGHAVWAHTYVTPRSIDRRGIRPALDLAVKRVLEKVARNLAVPPSELSVKLDGSLYAPAKYHHQETIIQGDVTEPVIAAASIIAKVRRDRRMRRLDRRFPEYGFARHKGYGTQAHREAVRRYGPCPIHRRSFLKDWVE